MWVDKPPSAQRVDISAEDRAALLHLEEELAEINLMWKVSLLGACANILAGQLADLSL
jgi:hypothetical protein